MPLHYPTRYVQRHRELNFPADWDEPEASSSIAPSSSPVLAFELEDWPQVPFGDIPDQPEEEEEDLAYSPSSTLPVERRFEVQDAQLVHKDEPSSAGGPTYGQLVFMDRGTAVEMGRMELGKDYWGTGAYILSTRFKEENVQALPFWKHFAIDKQHSRAKLTCNPPLALLRRNIHEGFKLRFCCGRIEGMPTCCCGGWTHEKVRSLLLAYR